jgi:XTP/dITP diphosphohydrolase
VGFDWEERRDVWKKVKEEITEFEAEVETLYNNAETDEAKAAAKQHATEEFGDVMFSLINAARLYKINPDNALEHTNQKFIKRFNYVEAKAKEKGQDLKDLTLEQMDAWWNEAKKLS